jgi:glycolate oxidase FAD binding subunit
MSTVVSTLESLLAANRIVSGEEITEQLKQSLGLTTADGSLPQAVVYPQTEAELCEVMACACAHRWRVLPFGHGSKLSWGGLARGFELAISTLRLNQVIDHAVGDMTLTAAAGLKLADLKPQLAQHGQFLAIDPTYPDSASLGGVVATADTGSLRQRYNSVRDMLIGISFVRYDGKLAKAGGRVVKNVAGYDLMKLMTGAYGSLGIVSQVTFRLYPIPEASKTVIVSGSAEAIGDLTEKLRQSPLTPFALDLFSPRLATDLGFKHGLMLAARFQSNLPGVNEQVSRLSAMISGDLSSTVLEGDGEAALWDQRWHRLSVKIGANSGGEEEPVIAKFGILPDNTVDLLSKIHGQFPDAVFAQVHVGSGIGLVSLPTTVATPDALKTLREWCDSFGGYLTILQAPKTVKHAIDVWGYSGNAFPVMRRIKETFDPHNLISAGRFVGEL